jgi:hypothetical protein
MDQNSTLSCLLKDSQAFKCLVYSSRSACCVSVILLRSYISSRQFGSAPSSSVKAICSFLADGETRSSGGLLLSEAGSDFISLGNIAGLLEAVELDVAVAAQVWGNSTVSSVGSSTSVDSSLADGVVDDTSVDIKSLGLGVSFQVDEHLADGLDRLLGPSTEGSDFVDLNLSVSGTSISHKGDNFSVFKAVFEVLKSFRNLKSLDGAGDIVTVLVMSSEVSDSTFSGFGGFGGLLGVLNHWKS